MASKKETSDQKTGVAAWKETEGGGHKRATVGSRGKRMAADRRRRMAIVIVVLIACVASLIVAWPIQERITRGLWFKGGTAQTMTATGDLAADQLSTAATTITKRLDGVGVSEYVVEPSEPASVVIKLPLSVDGAEIAQSIGGAGKLEFVRVDEIGDADALALINSGSKDAVMKEGTYTAFLDGDHVSSCETTMVSDGVYAVTIHFDDEGTKTFAEATEELAKDYGSIAIAVDGRVIAAPSVSEKIDGGQVSISGGFTQEEAAALKSVIDTETMPVNFTLTNSEDIDALAGKDTAMIIAGVAAVGIVVVGVIAFMRMRKTGLLVLATEVVLAVLMLGLMALMSRIEVFVLTPVSLVSGAFACVAGVACAWMVAARFCSLVADGKSIRGSSLTALAEALTPFAMPIVLVSTVSLVMLFLPIVFLRDLGLAIALGVIASVVAVLLFEVPLMRVLATGAMQNDPKAWGLDAKSEQTDVASSSRNSA